MDIFDILLLAVAVSMDATAVGMTDGMADPKMPIKNPVRRLNHHNRRSPRCSVLKFHAHVH